MYRGQPYMNGPRHTYLDWAVKSVNPRVLGRVMDRLMGRDILERNTDPPFLTIKYALPIYNDGQVDVTRAKQAFGRRAMKKLRRELHHPDMLIVKQALNTLSDLVHDPERVYEALNLKILDRLEDLYTHKDPFIRERAAMIMASIAGHALGREEILKKPSRLRHICFLLRDVHPTVRLQATLVLEGLAMCFPHGLCDDWLLARLNKLLMIEKESYLLAIDLRSLEFVLGRGNQEDALNMNTMDVVLALLDHPDPDVQSGAMACISVLTLHPEGRRIGEEIDILSMMRPKLYDDMFEIYSKAATVIMNNTLTTYSKLRALELDLIDRLLLLAGVEHYPYLQLHCLKALTNIAEAPQGRKILLEQEDTVEAIGTNGHEFLERALSTLLRVIRWKP